MIYEEFIDEGLKLDGKIRYVGIFDRGTLSGKMQKGLTNYFSYEESVKSARQSFIRWQSRNIQSKEIGEPTFALAEYEKVYRITMMLNNNSLLLVSIERDDDIFTIINKIKKFKEGINSKINLIPYQ